MREDHKITSQPYTVISRHLTKRGAKKKAQWLDKNHGINCTVIGATEFSYLHPWIVVDAYSAFLDKIEATG